MVAEGTSARMPDLDEDREPVGQPGEGGGVSGTRGLGALHWLLVISWCSGYSDDAGTPVRTRPIGMQNHTGNTE